MGSDTFLGSSDLGDAFLGLSNLDDVLGYKTFLSFLLHFL